MDITYPVGGGYLYYQIHGFGAEIPAIAADHHGATDGRRLDGAEHGLDKVLRVVGLLEHLYGLAQAAGAGLLAVERFRLDANRVHGAGENEIWKERAVTDVTTNQLELAEKND